ncbi:uncharacterized protein LOC131879677 [Tigriopus californicus]|uniref:uncharacterized protein LOC131879677 n=1 Tax=Tigriopus californicus TaxID=6832 RepID=UPI0027DA1979|nr:uncharacterized protein LOC131879677 [Tigriopus californicus]
MKKKAVNNSLALKNRRLKPTAVPSVFTNRPVSMRANLPSSRYTKVSMTQRFRKEQERHDELVKGYLEQRKVQDFNFLVTQISAEKMPAKFNLLTHEDYLLFISVVFDHNNGPRIESSFQIQPDLSFALFCHEAKVSRNDVNHISADGKIHYVDDVPNILAFLAGYAATKKSKLLSVEHRVEDICKFVETQDDLVVSQGSFNFSTEQLKLSFKSPNQRRYSPTLLAAALLWQNTSPALYKLLSTVDQSVCLPSVRHLQRFGQNLSVETGISPSTVEYLKSRLSSLNEREKILSVIFDEVYSSRRCEYSNGHFYGYYEEHAHLRPFCALC